MKNQAQLSWSKIVELAAVDVNIHMAATFDTFPANVPIIYPLKAPYNLWFSGVFRDIKWMYWAEMGLKT